MLFSRFAYYLSSVPTLLRGLRNPLGLPIAFLRGISPLLALSDGARFRVRTPMDVWIVKETCLDRQYERASVDIQDGWTVIDVGAALGDFAIDVARRCPHATVYACEPFPESFALLQENLALNGLSNVHPLPYAISSQVGLLDFAVAAVEAVQQSSVAGSSAPRQTIQVDSITLDHLFEHWQIAHCDYVKMDCEGAEYEIWFHTSPTTLQKIDHVCLETHDGLTRYDHHDLERFFQQHGFRTTRTPNPVWPHLGLLYAGKMR